MKRYLLALIALVPLCAYAQVTPNLQLNLPQEGTSGWGQKLNQNWTSLDNFLSGAQPLPGGLKLSGPLLLPGNPTAALQAATKQYVDSAVVGGCGLCITGLTGDVTATGSGSTVATVKGINGVLLTSLANGMLKVTAGVPSIAVAGSDFLLPSNNLSDLTNTATARTNLGLGTAATHASTDFDAAGAAAAAQSAAQTFASNASNLTTGTINAGRIPVLNQNTTGNAATASALAVTPTLCSTGQAARGILPNGNATGCFTASGGSMVYPGAGIPNSTGTAWGTSYQVGNTGSDIPQLSSGLLSSSIIPTLNQNTTGNAATATALAATPTGCLAGQFATGVDAHGNAICASGGSGTVTSVSSGNLSPLFTSTVSTSTTTPAISFTLSSAAQNTVLAGPSTGGAGAPSYQAAPTFSAANLTNFPTFNQNTTGTAANLSGTPALPNGTTATTQIAGDATTKLATDAFATSAASTAQTNAEAAFTGDVAKSAGSFATTVTKINGVALAGLATGILKNTTATGVPSIAVGDTDYQNPVTLTTTGTTGSATFSGDTLNIPQYQGALTLTTTGSTGPATLVGNTLNIPQYSGAGGAMVWPATAGIAIYAGGSAWGTSLTAPTGAIVGTTDTQTLTNKTVDGVGPTTMSYLDATSSVQTQLNSKQNTLSLTTTGSSGAATLVGSTLNVPNYTYALPTASTSVLGGVKVDGTSVTISGGVISSVATPSFSAVTAGTNTNALLVGTGGSLGTTGSGTITATNLSGGALGSMPYQSAAGTTAFLASPTTSGHTFVHAWQPSGSAIAPTALDLATYLASPAAIGGTTPAAGSFTTVSASSAITIGTAPTACGSATGCEAFTEASTTGTPTAGQDYIRADSTSHTLKYSVNGGAEQTIGSGGGGSGTVNSGTANQLAYYATTGTAVSGTTALPSGTTATTQGANDNSTKVATTAYADAGVASVKAIYTNNGIALPTTAIAAGACTAATGSPFTATGVATTNVAVFGWASDPSSVTGYGTTGGLVVRVFPGSGTVGVKVCNPNGSSITPAAISINVRVLP